MCSQPPRKIDDSSRVNLLLKTIDLMDPNTKDLGITGGEPTLLGEGFLSLIRRSKEKVPDAALHVLTNGRLFTQRSFAGQLAQIRHPNLMLGIPLYSDLDFQHDYVVQAQGAFDETILGLYNLAEVSVPIEIRVVIHKQTYSRLARLAEYIVRNFPFVAHIALMGLENTGFTRPNIDKLWIDPVDYQRELKQATEILFLAGQNVSIYNHQLCVLESSLWQFAVKSISDWKNIYLHQCAPCSLKNQCGGFFQTSLDHHSRAITPFSSHDPSNRMQGLGMTDP
jgi:His-Xaa-Ser system radical SAM maturase HxsC